MNTTGADRNHLLFDHGNGCFMLFAFGDHLSARVVKDGLHALRIWWPPKRKSSQRWSPCRHMASPAWRSWSSLSRACDRWKTRANLDWWRLSRSHPLAWSSNFIMEVPSKGWSQESVIPLNYTSITLYFNKISSITKINTRKPFLSFDTHQYVLALPLCLALAGLLLGLLLELPSPTTYVKVPLPSFNFLEEHCTKSKEIGEICYTHDTSYVQAHTMYTSESWNWSIRVSAKTMYLYMQ